MNNYEKINRPQVNAELKADFLKRQYEAALEEIQRLKSDRPQGEWIVHFDDLFPEESSIECSVCHEEQPLGIDDNFCPNCGARMKGADNND